MVVEPELVARIEFDPALHIRPADDDQRHTLAAVIIPARKEGYARLLLIEARHGTVLQRPRRKLAEEKAEIIGFTQVARRVRHYD